MKIYSERFSAARGWHWQYERDCNANNQHKWLAIFRADEPGVRFIVSARGPKESELNRGAK